MGADGGHDGRMGFLLPDAPVPDVDAYLAAGGGDGPAWRRIALGPDGTIDEITAVGPARPGRRRLPDRAQVALGPRRR